MPPFASPNSATCVLGQYCNSQIVAKTLVLILPFTLLAPFATRDTVAVETPASLATSFIVLDIIFSPAGGQVG
jgi:hypothetical protein